MRRSAYAGRRVVDHPGLGFCERNEVAERTGLHTRMELHQELGDIQRSHRQQIVLHAERQSAKVGIDRQNSVKPQQYRVSVRCGSDHDFRTHVAARTRAVVHVHLLPQCLSQLGTMMRASVSVPPPAAVGTASRIGCVDSAGLSAAQTRVFRMVAHPAAIRRRNPCEFTM